MGRPVVPAGLGHRLVKSDWHWIGRAGLRRTPWRAVSWRPRSCTLLAEPCPWFQALVSPETALFLVLQPEPQPGDLIEIFRPFYRHWAIYVGNGYVIHLAPPSKGAQRFTVLGLGAEGGGGAVAHRGPQHSSFAPN